MCFLLRLHDTKVSLQECRRCSYCTAASSEEVQQVWMKNCCTSCRLVQRYSLGTVGAPAASNPHSCSPGLESLQSPPVPAAIGSACPGVAVGDRALMITTFNLGSDAKA